LEIIEGGNQVGAIGEGIGEEEWAKGKGQGAKAKGMSESWDDRIGESEGVETLEDIVCGIAMQVQQMET
jgi:hypothetical protein